MYTIHSDTSSPHRVVLHWYIVDSDTFDPLTVVLHGYIVDSHTSRYCFDISLIRTLLTIYCRLQWFIINSDTPDPPYRWFGHFWPPTKSFYTYSSSILTLLTTSLSFHNDLSSILTLLTPHLFIINSDTSGHHECKLTITALWDVWRYRIMPCSRTASLAEKMKSKTCQKETNTTLFYNTDAERHFGRDLWVYNC